jgi:NTE family protein
VAVFYSYGYTPDEIFRFVKEIKLFRYVRPAMSMSGLLKLETTANIYKKYIEKDDFSALKIPVSVAAVKLRTGECTYFDKGSLMSALMATSSVPVVFNPVKVDDEYYIDGGIVNNMPVEPLLDNVDKIIGINCIPVNRDYALGNFKSLVERSFQLIVNTVTYNKKHMYDLFLEPAGLEVMNGFDFSKSDELFRIGYDYGKEMAPKIIELID